MLFVSTEDSYAHSLFFPPQSSVNLAQARAIRSIYLFSDFIFFSGQFWHQSDWIFSSVCLRSAGAVLDCIFWGRVMLLIRVNTQWIRSGTLRFRLNQSDGFETDWFGPSLPKKTKSTVSSILAREAPVDTVIYGVGAPSLWLRCWIHAVAK